jgi:ABC-type multidrug transport system fused ATPase/permease subunit
MLRQPLGELTEQARDFQRASASVARIRELLATTSQLADGPGTPLPAGPLDVRFENVAFGYGVAGLPIVERISFTIRPGKVLGILGRTGSGKTTLTRLLFRLYDPDTGSIRLSGVDVHDVRLAELHRRVAIVTQEVQLFHATVRNNLALFDPAIGDERIMALLDEIGLMAWYRRLPAGLDTELTPGKGGLSAGEAQLLAFARVLLREPDVVILDEASSRLDPATEQLIERALARLFARRTGIVIAHRLATLARVDDILVMEDGRIAAYGPRQQLARDGQSRFHALLHASQQDAAGTTMREDAHVTRFA